MPSVIGITVNEREYEHLLPDSTLLIGYLRDTLPSSLYRRHMAGVLAKRSVTQLYEDGVCNYRSKP
jgi:hypothetical protein